MTEPISIEPGVRMLLPTDRYHNIPAHIAGPLLTLGRACNDAGSVAASAHLDHNRISDVQQRLAQDRQEESIEWDTAERLWEASSQHIERVAGIYASVATRYVTAAVEAASHAINRRLVTVPDVKSTDIVDVLLLAELHVPLIQLDETSSDPRRQRRARVENAALRATHEALQQAMAQTIKYDEAGAGDAARSFVPGPQLGGALHEYACACAIALAIALEEDQPHPV